MLTVLFVNHVGRVSGAEKTLRDLIAYLPDDIRAAVACPGPAEDGLAGAVRRLGVEWYEIPPWRPHRRPLWRLAIDMVIGIKAMGQVADVVRHLRPDVLHANSLPAVLLLMQMSDRPPMIWQARDLRMPERLAAAAIDTADRVVAISRAVAEALTQADASAVRSKLSVIYNGIDLREIEGAASADLRAELDLPHDVPLVGTAAQLVPWKRLELFLEVASLVASASDAHFVVAGADLFGEHGAYVRRLGRLQEQLGLADRVHWLGYRRDVLSVLAGLDVYVHCADAEPLGRSILEAMALGRPCVVPAAAGPAEIVGDSNAAMLYSPGDARSAAGTILRILQDKRLAATLGEAAARHVREHFDAARMAAEYAAVYRELAG